MRTLKSEKAEKSEIDAAVKILLQLKKDYKEATGEEYQPSAPATRQPPKEANSQKPMSNTRNSQAKTQEASNPHLKKQTRLGLEAKKMKICQIGTPR